MVVFDTAISTVVLASVTCLQSADTPQAGKVLAFFWGSETYLDL